MRFLGFIFILLQFTANAQGFKVRHYLPGAVTHLTKTIFETSPGNYFGGGLIVDSLNGQQLCITGLGSQGQILWTKKYGNSQFLYLYNQFTSRAFYKKENNIYFAASASLNGKIRSTGALLKFDLNGDTLWQKTYGDPDTLEDVVPQMVTASVDGGLLITGFFQNWSANGYSKCLLIKTDANGNELWRRKIGKVVPNVQDGKCIIQDSASKKIVIVGYQYIGNANSAGNYDNILILDSLGNQPLRYNFLNGVGGYILDMIQTKDKKLVAVGYKYSNQSIGGTNLSQAYAVKFDLNQPNPAIWKIDGFDKITLSNGFFCIREQINGDLIISGTYDTLRAQNLNENDLIRLTRIDAYGNIKWNQYYNYKLNASNSDNMMGARAIELTSDGGLVAAIECFNTPNPNPFFFVKWDSTGCDTTQAYCQMVAAGIGKNYLNKSNIHIYPNPSSGLITVSLATSGEQLSLSIEDVAGREVKRQELTAALQEQTIDLKALANGVYVLSVCKNKEVLYKTKLIKQD